MAEPSSSKPLTTGPAAAALVAVGLGLLVLGLSQVFSERSASFKQAMQGLGNLWMPGAPGLGPYSGKETAALLVWLFSWAILGAVWRRREISLIGAAVVAFALIGLATTILWPPVTHLLIK